MSTLTRTYSSPSLKDQNYKWETQEYKYGEEDDEFYVIGDRVYVDGYRAGSVAYFGEVDFASGDYVGLVLDHQTGEHNGKVHGREYFQCAPFHGLFVRPYRVSRIPDSMFSSSATSSRLSTPLPSFQRACEQRSSMKSPGCSTLDSYFYDDDYRAPSIASLEQKLRSLQQGKSNNNHSTTSGRVSLTTGKVGILKNSNSHSRPESSLSSMSAKLEELSRPTSTSPSRSAVTFNFRPKRAPLDEAYEHQDPTKSLYKDSSRIGFISECRKGDRVVVRNERGTREQTGVLRYLGETSFATGEWAGVELDLPEGKNDGSVLGHRYFYCPKDYGLFVPATRVRKAGQQLNEEFKSIRSTIKSPPPSAGKYSSSKLKQYLDMESPTTSEATTKRSHSSSSSLMSPDNNSSYNSTQRLQLYQDECAALSSPLTSNYSLMDPKFPSNFSTKPPLFSDADLELQIKRSLQKPAIRSSKVTIANIEPVQPKSVKYTFSSSKYDGNPIVRRTVEYE